MASAVDPDDILSVEAPSVASGTSQHGPPAYAERAWICLHRDAFPRKQCISIVLYPWFDKAVLILILLNCCTMTVFSNPVLNKLISARPPGWPQSAADSPWAYARWDLPFHRKDYCTSLGPEFMCSAADWVDFGFLVIFAIEMVLKMIAMGLIMHPNAYLRSTWNWLDFVVVTTGTLTMLFPTLPAVNTIRLVKMLRPLRSINRVRGMRVLVQTILKAGPQICNVLVFLLFFLIIFALFGVAFFRGNLRHTCHAPDGAGGWASTGITCDAECSWDSETLKLINCSSLGAQTKQLESYAIPWRWTYSCRPGQQCRCRNGGSPNDAACTWKDNPNYGATHFDSLPWAMVSLFQAITLEGWVDQMYDLMDGCSVWVFVYYVALVMIGAIVILNLFLAVLCNSLLESNDDVEETEDDVPDAEGGEKGVLKALRAMKHSNVIRQRCLELVRWKYFDVFIQSCIVINTVVMAAKFSPRPTAQLAQSIVYSSQWDYMPAAYYQFLNISNIFLTFIFACECVIKIVAMGPRTYRKDRMNVFDLVVVIFSIFEIVLDLLERYAGTDVYFPLPLSVLRAVRIFRLFKLVNSVESMRKIILTLLESVDAVFYLAGLMGLAILIFILLGMELFGGFYPRGEFGYTRSQYPDVFQANYITWDLDDEWPSRYNFDDFGTALLTIFVVLSGENWNEIMWNSHRATWDSHVVLSVPWAVPYFILLFVIGNLLLFNLFIAILLSNFGVEEEEDDDDAGPSEPASAFPSCEAESTAASVSDRSDAAPRAPSMGAAADDEPAAGCGSGGGPSLSREPTADRRASTPAGERRPGIGFHSAKSKSSSSNLLADVAASALREQQQQLAQGAGATAAVLSSAVSNLSVDGALGVLVVDKSTGAAGGKPKKKPAPELVYEFGAYRDPTGERLKIKRGKSDLGSNSTPDEKRKARTSIRTDTADLGAPWANEVHAVLSSADVGKTVVIDGAKFTVGGKERGVHWGDASPPAGEACSSVLRSVEEGFKGKVTLEDGTTFENPWMVYLALFTKSDIGRTVEIDNGDVKLEGLAHLALWGDGPGSVRQPKPDELSGTITSVEEKVGGKVVVTSDHPGKFIHTFGNPRDGAIQYPPFPTWLENGDDETGSDRSCHLFSWSNPLRVACCKLILHPMFEVVIIILILVSTCCLMIDLPHLRAAHPLKRTISTLNVVFFVIFFIEMCSKIVASGFVKSKTPKHYTEVATPYLRDPWNMLDACIVLISFITLFPTPGMEGFRSLRALRPLRLASRVEDLKLTVDTLALSIPAMGSLIMVAFLFFLIFGILGLELFGGKLGYCMDPNFSDLPYGSRVIPGMNGTQNDYEECMSLPRYNLTRRTTDGILLTDMADLYPERVPGVPGSGMFLEFTEFPQWFYPQFGSFDNIAYSLALLFEVSALEGWPDVMHRAMDTDDDQMLVVPWPLNSAEQLAWPLAGQGPLQKHKPTAWLAGVFFVFWIILGCFVVVNMTIGVVVDTFAHIKQTNDGVILMSVSQQEWVRTQKQAFQMKPMRKIPEPTARWRRRAYGIVTSDMFEIVIMGVILLNMMQMATDWWEPYDNAPYQPDLKLAHKYINVVFFVVYLCEMSIKWIGFGLAGYFSDPWNNFDFLLILVSTFDVITSFAATDAGTAFPPSLFRMLRLVRVLRILRIIKSAKNMRTLVMTVFISMPQLSNIMTLILLLVLIFDMMCVNIFYSVNYTPGTTDLSADKSFSIQRGEVYNPDDYHFSDDGTNWGEGINRHANFQFFWTGMLTLVRSATGESFNNIMHDLYGYDWGHNRLTCCPQCGPIVDGANLPFQTLVVPSTQQVMANRVTPESSCGDSFWAFLIYFLFQMIMAYIVLSIMIGVILENFNSIGSPNQTISIDDIEAFREVWLKYDPEGTYRTAAHNVIAIISQLQPPLGVYGQTPAPSRADLLRRVQELNLPDHSGQIHFNETLTHLSKLVQERETGEIRLPDVDAVRKIARLSQNIPGLSKLEGASHNTYTNYVLALLQSRFRAYLDRALKRDADEYNVASRSMSTRSKGSLVDAAKNAKKVVVAGATRIGLIRDSSSGGGSGGELAPVIVPALSDPNVPAVATVKGVALVRPRGGSS